MLKKNNENFTKKLHKLRFGLVSFLGKMWYTMAMFDSEFFKQCYNKISGEPDFPGEKADILWQRLPKGSRDLAAKIYLLPLSRPWKKEDIAYAEVLTLLTLSSLIHDDMERHRAFDVGEAVLYGDYLFALAYSFLPEHISEEKGMALTEHTCRFCESRVGRKAPADSEEALRRATADYGAPLGEIAAEAVKGSTFNEEERRRYILCAEKIGTVWGTLCEGYDINLIPLFREVEELAGPLPVAEEFGKIIEEWEDIAVENRG